jgi:hypothetical protein
MIWRERLTELVTKWREREREQFDPRSCVPEDYNAGRVDAYSVAADELSAVLTALEGAEPPTLTDAQILGNVAPTSRFAPNMLYHRLRQQEMYLHEHLMETNINNWPESLQALAKERCDRYGMCGEVFAAAVADWIRGRSHPDSAAPAAAREGAEPERPQPERVDIDYRGYSFKMPFSERPQPTCATCRHSQVMRSPMPDLDAWPLVCANGVRIKPDDPGLTMPVYGRRVPDDFGCSMHEPKPEPVAHAQTPERP